MDLFIVHITLMLALFGSGYFWGRRNTLRRLRYTEAQGEIYDNAPTPVVNKAEILAQLENTFTTQQAIRVFEQFDYKKRQSMNYINQWIDLGLIERVKTGNYRKL